MVNKTPRGATYCTRWASVRTIDAAQRLRNNIDLSDEIVIFTLRADGVSRLITPKMRVSFRGRIYSIDTVRNVEERDRRLELTARTLEYLA